MIIGTFCLNKETLAYHGDLLGLGFQLASIEITPITKHGSKGPDYRVTASALNGSVELGAGWNRTSDNGREFVSVSLDSPALASPVNAALFTAEDGSEASLVWNRPKAKVEPEAKSKPSVETAA